MNRSSIAMAVVAAVAFGAGTPLAKLLLNASDPWILAGLLYLGAGAALALVRAAAPTRAETPLRRPDLPKLGLVVVSGGVLGPWLLMAGLSRTDATASLALNVEAIATMAIAWIVHREPVDRRLALGALAIVAGAALLAWTGRRRSTRARRSSQPPACAARSTTTRAASSVTSIR